MANYNGYTRTNMFRVTDEEKIKDIVNSISSEDNIELFIEHDSKGNRVFGFGAYCTIDGIMPVSNDDSLPEDCEVDKKWDNMVKELQSILPDDEVVIFTEVGYEKLRYVGGYTTVITNKSVEMKSLEGVANQTAAAMLNIPEYNAIY